MSKSSRKIIYINASDISGIAGRNKFETLNYSYKKFWERLEPERSCEIFSRVLCDSATESGVCGEGKTLNMVERELYKDVSRRYTLARRATAVSSFAFVNFLMFYFSFKLRFVSLFLLLNYLFRMALVKVDSTPPLVVDCIYVNTKKYVGIGIDRVMDSIFWVGRLCEKPNSNEMVSERNDKVRYHFVNLGKIDKRNPDTEIVLKIGGRFDGVCNKTFEIVEAKTRTRQLYNKVFENEKIQATIYMAIMGDKFKRVRLTERFENETATHVIHWDKNYYDELISDVSKNLKRFFSMISCQTKESDAFVDTIARSSR